MLTLVPTPSLLTVTANPAEAQITVDGTPYDRPTTIAAGGHQVTVSRVGYAEQQQEVTASLGEPVALSVALVPLVPIHVMPPQAALSLDGGPIDVVKGGIAVPSGSHALVASAQGFRDRRIEIPAMRAPDYRVDIELVPVESVTMKTPSDPIGPTPSDNAFVLSFDGTIVSWFTVAAVASSRQGPVSKWFGATGAIGTLLGPSFGHWYAHSVVTRGLGLRMLGLGAAFLGGGCVFDGNCGHTAMTLWIVGGLLYAGGTVDDIATVRRDARDFWSRSASLTIVPTIGGDHSGVTIVGRF